MGAYIGILPGLARRLPEDMVEAGGDFSEPMTPSISDPSSLLEREMEIPGIPSSNATEEILAGLADFRSKLKKLNNRLHESVGNRPALDHCANQLRQANHEYLEDANQAITRLEDETEGTSQHDQFKTSVLQQAEAVGQANAAIDSLLTSSNLEEVHQGLVATTDQLDKQASEVERHASDTHGSPDEERWAADRIVSLSKLLEQASQQLESSDEVQRMPMAGIMLDTQLADGTVVDVTPRLVDGLLKVVAPLLEDGQLVASDQGKLLMLLVGDDEASAIQRCERLRQQVATTTFVCDGERRRLTASCSVADNATGLPVDQIVTHVEESLVEARRYGPNRCFHHDGKFPAPVVPHTMGVEALTVEI